jgi:3-oxoacyl-[acyl-carrier protein] reductase
MNLNLADKTALVTAASSGIGSGVAEALAEAGVRVAISGRTLASLEAVAETIASRAGGRPVIVVGDVGAKSGPADIAAEALAALGGRIDILVNNAGGARPITDEVDDDYWDESFTLNFMAARRLTDLIIPAMKAERWGRIISISGALVARSSTPPPPPRRRWRAGQGP